MSGSADPPGPVSAPVASVQTQEQGCTEGEGWMLGKSSSPDVWRCSGTAAQGSVGSPSQEVFKDHGDVTLGTWSVGTVGWVGLGGLFQPSVVPLYER